MDCAYLINALNDETKYDNQRFFKGSVAHTKGLQEDKQSLYSHFSVGIKIHKHTKDKS